MFQLSVTRAALWALGFAILVFGALQFHQHLQSDARPTTGKSGVGDAAPLAATALESGGKAGMSPAAALSGDGTGKAGLDL